MVMFRSCMCVGVTGSYLSEADEGLQLASCDWSAVS